MIQADKLENTKNLGFENDSAIMVGKGKIMSENEEKIACHVCKTMIPKATALHAEGEEYVLHFCNLDCMDYWRNQKKDKEKKTNE
jgi:hypothetical protein